MYVTFNVKYILYIKNTSFVLFINPRASEVVNWIKKRKILNYDFSKVEKYPFSLIF